LSTAVACGSSGASDARAGSDAAGGGTAAAEPSTSASTGVSGRPTDWRAWAQCMRDHGVAEPDLDPRTGRPVDGTVPLPLKSGAIFAGAVQACAGVEPPGSGSNKQPLTPAELAQMRQWATCMREHGVPVPDPDPNEPDGPHFERLPNMPPTAVIDAAIDACHDKLPRQ
jgi:hypothetical protein